MIDLLTDLNCNIHNITFSREFQIKSLYSEKHCYAKKL